MTHVNMIIRSLLIFHPIPMAFWLKTTNIIYKNWLNSHIYRIMFKISRHKNIHVTVKVPHPVLEPSHGEIMKHHIDISKNFHFDTHTCINKTSTTVIFINGRFLIRLFSYLTTSILTLFYGLISNEFQYPNRLR